MIEWPFCSIHQKPMQLVCIGGNWQYICKECQKTPLTYSVIAERNKKEEQNDQH